MGPAGAARCKVIGTKVAPVDSEAITASMRASAFPPRKADDQLIRSVGPPVGSIERQR